MSNTHDKTKFNLVLLTTLEDVDKSKALEVISDPLLDGKELSALLEASMLEEFVDKNTNKPLKLSNEVIMAGLRNKILRL